MALSTLLHTLLLLTPLTLAEGLYSKSSPVLQLDSRSYTRLIEKSNYTSIIEFYAPWCGHCKNLKPAYEKAATSLAGTAKVAAVNCDEESNKAFCGGMGVQGFPTLKLVRPKKKGGKPLVEDYQGPRTAKGIKEAVREKMPNHVRKVTDGDIEGFMGKGGKPKALFFTEKATVSPLVKSIAIDFLGSLDVAQVHSSQTKAAGLFMVEEFPKVYLMTSPEHVPEMYEGKLKNEALEYEGQLLKEPLIEFFERSAGVLRNPEWTADVPKAKTKKDKKPEKKAKKMPQGHPEATAGGKCPAGHGAEAASETIDVDQENVNPTATASPDPKVAAESPAPIQLPVEPAPEIQTLDSEMALQKNCLNTKSGTCVLALVAPGAEPAKSGIDSLSELAHKHAQRKGKLFPFYRIPETNEAGQALLSSLGIKDPSAHATIIALNAKRGWWTRFTSEQISQSAVETWVDNIRFGDFSKQKLPDGLVKEAEPKVEAEEPIRLEKPIDLGGDWPEGLKVEVVEDPDHDEL